MKHYVNLKFISETDKASVLAAVEDALEQACHLIEGFQRYELLKVKDWSEENPKVLLVLEFTDIASLKVYLEHQLHQKLLNTVKPHLADKAIFDGLI